jgi:hypothetical protein
MISEIGNPQAAAPENHVLADNSRVWLARLRNIAQSHLCWNHPLFARLETVSLTSETAGNLLRNYDEHASALRRLLLKSATIMPEEAVTYVLENVRNEYGNGDPNRRHQLQLTDVARCSGVSMSSFAALPVQSGVKAYIRAISRLYYPVKETWTSEENRPAIASGAIAATEILALREFEKLQVAFAKLDLAHHIWFHHVTIEAEHSDESLALALHFLHNNDAWQEVEYGMLGVLDANVSLYDGLLAAIS